MGVVMFMFVLWTEVYNVLAQIVYLIFKTPFHIDLHELELNSNLMSLFCFFISYYMFIMIYLLYVILTTVLCL